MIYESSLFTTKSMPKYSAGQVVNTHQGKARVRSSRLNGERWEYGLEIIGITKGGSIWFTESSITGVLA